MKTDGSVPILVIDDERDQYELTQAILNQAGYTVLMATNAQAGLQLYELYRPFLIITDFSMPDMSGSDFVRQLRQRGYTQVPVMMVSAHSLDYINQTLTPDYPVNLVLSKPIDFDLLLTMVYAYYRQFCELGYVPMPRAA